MTTVADNKRLVSFSSRSVFVSTTCHGVMFGYFNMAGWKVFSNKMVILQVKSGSDYNKIWRDRTNLYPGWWSHSQDEEPWRVAEIL